MGLLPKIWPTIIFNQFYGQNAKEDANFILMFFGFFFFNKLQIHTIYTLKRLILKI